MVKIEYGSIFDSNAQTLVNTINCVGVMGKGLALEFKNRYPAMFDKYKSFCNKGVFKPGVLWIYKAEDGKWILNFPTKVDWKNPSELSYIEEGLKKFVEIWKEKGIKSIAFPLLGCKNGGLDANVVIPLMERYLSDCEGLDVTIYDDRGPKVEEPNISKEDELSLKENVKEIVINSKPLVEEEPPKVTDEDEEEAPAIQEVETEAEPEHENEMPISEKRDPADIQEDKGEDKGEPDIPNETINEDAEILREIIEERKAVHNEVDKILEDFAKGDNSPEYRKKVARKIVNVVNRRGFPAGSVFQI